MISAFRQVYLIGPLLLGLSVSPTVDAQEIGAWLAETKTSLYAVTSSDSGNLFGQRCDASEGSCYYFLGLSSSCDEDSTYPVLANSDAGSASMQLICRGSTTVDRPKMYRYFFSDFDAIDQIVRNATRVGFASPLRGDQFSVVRFSLQGAVTAITVMRNAAEKEQARNKQPTPTRRGRDQVL